MEKLNIIFLLLTLLLLTVIILFVMCRNYNKNLEIIAEKLSSFRELFFDNIEKQDELKTRVDNLENNVRWIYKK